MALFFVIAKHIPCLIPPPIIWLLLAASMDIERTPTHDSVVLELQYALQYCGFWINREERDCFLMADPNDRHIPDLIVTNPTDSAFPQVLLDVSITSPLTGALYGQLDNAVSRELALSRKD
jgi:hypothetical protein